MYKLTDTNIIIKDGELYIPMDLGNQDYLNYLEWVDLGNTPEPAHTPAELLQIQKDELTQVIQNHLDQIAFSKGYDNMISACSYAGSVNPFQAEGIALLNWRSDCWVAAIQILDDVTNEIIPVPTPSELITMLPSPPA